MVDPTQALLMIILEDVAFVLPVSQKEHLPALADPELVALIKQFLQEDLLIIADLFDEFSFPGFTLDLGL
jgi:hypothetical protein